MPLPYADNLCRQPMPTTYADHLCRHPMPTTYVDNLCRQPMPTTYADKLDNHEQCVTNIKCLAAIFIHTHTGVTNTYKLCYHQIDVLLRLSEAEPVRAPVQPHLCAQLKQHKPSGALDASKKCSIFKGSEKGTGWGSRKGVLLENYLHKINSFSQ